VAPAIATVDWMHRPRCTRRVVVAGAISINALVGAVITLPILPQHLVGGGPVVAVGFDDLSHDPDLPNCTVIDVIRTIDGIDNDENGERIWRCDPPARPWRSIWPNFTREG
jgi:hypothetical protein